MKTHSQRVAASLAMLAMAVTPATALAASHTNSSVRKAAAKYCKSQESKLGKAKFTKKYGPKNAYGKCVSTYEKKHKK